MKAQLLFWLIAGGGLVLAATGWLLISHDRTVVITVPPVTAPGTVIGRTPVVGYRLDCGNNGATWQVYAVVDASDVNAWPPREACQ